MVASGFLLVAVSFKDNFFEIAKQIEIFTTLFKELDKNYVDETNPGELMDTAIKSMLASLDPYTVYFNEQDVLKFKINNTGEYTGIGAIIKKKEGKIIIAEVYKNFPADKAGLKAGDEIIRIGDVNLLDFKEDASQLLKGAKNTKIEIKFNRQNTEKNATIILDEVEVKSVPFYGKIDETTGYIVLNKFNNKATAETKAAIEDLKKQGVTQLVLDLRGNPGGLLNESVTICNLFVPKNEIIVTTKSRIEKHNKVYKTPNEPLDTEIPLVILIDGKSASASEIVSGALQDLDRAVVVGSRSFGKGLVQRPVNLTYNTQLKVTISKYYTPSGRCIQALNYAQKDKDGKATRTETKDFNEFKTRKGRIVYDGGGVTPDVVFDAIENNNLLIALSNKETIFNFATQYYYKNCINSTKIPVLSDNDFEDFKQFLKSEKFSFETETATSLKKLLATAKKENLDQSITAEYQQLVTALQKSEASLLEKNKKEILNLLLEELITRMQYEEGLYQYKLANNSEIQKATAVVKNKTQYNTILKK